MISSFLMLVLLPSTLAQASFCPSATDTVHFELVTGKVFTSPEDMLDSRPGTLMLTDCIDLCRCDLNLLLVNLHLKPRTETRFAGQIRLVEQPTLRPVSVYSSPHPRCSTRVSTSVECCSVELLPSNWVTRFSTNFFREKVCLRKKQRDNTDPIKIASERKSFDEKWRGGNVRASHASSLKPI